MLGLIGGVLWVRPVLRFGGVVDRLHPAFAAQPVSGLQVGEVFDIATKIVADARLGDLAIQTDEAMLCSKHLKILIQNAKIARNDYEAVGLHGAN